MGQIKTSIIIVNYNTIELVSRCLDSVLEKELPQTEIIVVDNASTDGSIAVLKNRFQKKITLLPQPENLGFARANNLAAKKARGRYLYFLNSDTELHSSSLEPLHQTLSLPHAGLVGSRLVYPDNSFQDSSGALPTLTSLLYWAWFIDDIPMIGRKLNSYHQSYQSQYSSASTVGWVSGASLMIKASVFRLIKGFDSNIFMYGEDVELCQKAKLKGYDTWYNPQVTVMHHGRGSTGGGVAPTVSGEWLSLIKYIEKYQPRSRNAARVILKLGALFRWAVYLTVRHNKTLAYEYKKAVQLV